MSSVVWLFGLVVVAVLSLCPGLASVWARAANAARANARAAIPMIFIEPPRLFAGDSGDSRSGIQPTTARRAARRGEQRRLSAARRDHSPIRFSVPAIYALKLEPHPQVCLAFGFLKLNPLWPNWPST